MVSCSSVAPVLETSVSRVFSGLTYAQVRSQRENGSPDCCDGRLLASVGMRGGVEGVVSIAAPVGLCADFARAQLGARTDVTDIDALAVSALAEIASVAAGCVATILEPVETTWLTPPAVSGSSSHEWDVMRVGRHTTVLEVDGREVLVSADVNER